MGVALENARLFDETQRLFKESEQRKAELAMINSMQEGTGGRTRLPGDHDRGGRQARERYSIRADIGVRWHEPRTNMLHCLYDYEHGQKLSFPPMPADGIGIWAQLVKTRQPIILNRSD